MDETDVLIVGAGPTGLVTALWLAQAGVRFRIVDAAAEPGTTSRALVVHARTLEFYRQLGIVDRVIAAGLHFVAVNLWVHGRHRARAVLGDVGIGISAYPYMLVLPQDVHERLLVAELRRLGVEVERGTTVERLSDREFDVVAELRGPSGARSTVVARYVAGCDGAHSMVRRATGVGFPGGTYERTFYVADVDLESDIDKELHVALDAADFTAIFPLAGARKGRLIGTIREAALALDRPLGWDDVSGDALRRLGLRVTGVNWFSTYRVHHRVADRFRAGRCFLLGDAGHIHSPVGGQGMNTGIGDAVNLAWKLVEVVQRGAPEALLDSYEPERIAFARRLVATTDRAFVIATRNGAIARFVRLRVVPVLLPIAMRIRAARRFAFRTLSQTAIAYRTSPISVGELGGLRAGDRLPWVEDVDTAGQDNFASLAERAWQAHVYGDASPYLRDACARAELPLVEFSWRPGMRRLGFVRDAVYVVRPDGHVGFVGASTALEPLAAYLERWRGGTS